MIDFHNHFIYDLDDGPGNIDESMDMIRTAYEQGITDIIQTVHFQHPKMENKNIGIDYINKKIKKIEYRMLEEKIDIKIHLAAEVFYLPNLLQIYSNPLVTLGNGKYMLIEFTTNIFPVNYEEEFYKIQNKGISPIIAHPERYRFVQNDLNILDKWISKDFIIQLDAGSLLGQFGEKIKKISYDIIEMYGIHLIGSDAHNNKKRNFCLSETYNLLSKKYNDTIVETLKDNSLSLLNGNKMSLIPLKQKHSLLKNIKSKFARLIKYK